MIIDLENFKSIESLKPGEFAIPKLDWPTTFPALTADTKGSVIGMYNTVKKRTTGEIQDCLMSLTEEEVNETMLEDKINALISDSQSTNVELVFHLIEIWGGKAGRTFYNRKDVTPLNLEEYQRLIRNTKGLPFVPENFEMAIGAMVRFIAHHKYLNIAFVSKHVSLWQRFSGASNVYPIYDSVMAKNTMGRNDTHNQFADLYNYWNQFYLHRNELIESNTKVSTSIMERALFNYFNSDSNQFLKRSFK